MHNFPAAYPAGFHFSRNQWSHHFEAFRRLLNGDDALAPVFRMGVIFFHMVGRLYCRKPYPQKHVFSVFEENGSQHLKTMTKPFAKTAFLFQKPAA